MAVKPEKLVCVIPASRGLVSTAPKYSIPMAVVNQSMEPIRMRITLGDTFAPNMFASPFHLLSYYSVYFSFMFQVTAFDIFLNLD